MKSFVRDQQHQQKSEYTENQLKEIVLQSTMTEDRMFLSDVSKMMAKIDKFHTEECKKFKYVREQLNWNSDKWGH